MAKATSGRKKSRYRAAAVCTPGFEAVCAAELKALGCRPKPAGPGLLEFDANARQLYSANVWLRTAGRIVVRIDTFRATDFFHLQDHASRIEWDRLIPPGHAPRFRISSNDSKLYHTKAIAQRLHQVSLPPSIGEPEQLFIVRIDRNNVTISIDSSGEALHKRPWRTELGEAPLRTTMAAAILNLSGWDPSQVLIDPFCGSGTIGIEAALLARGLPPGGERAFAFHDWPDFDAGSWASIIGSIGAADRTDDARGPILMSDRDAAAITMAKANAERAGVSEDIEFETRVVAHLKGRTDTGALVTNPPYGRRLGKGQVNGLYSRLGAVARERLPAFSVTVISPNTKLAKTADGGLRSAARFRHGGLAVDVFHRAALPSEQTKTKADKGDQAPGDPDSVSADLVDPELGKPNSTDSVTAAE